MDDINDLTLRFALAITSSEEETYRGCDKFCNELLLIETLSRKLNRESTEGRERMQAKRLIEAIMGVLELAIPHRDKLQEQEWMEAQGW